MYLGIALVPPVGRQKVVRRWGLYECTTCKVVFKDVKEKRVRPNHFHNRECYNASIKKGGPSYDKMVATNLEKWGVKCTVHHPEIKEGIKQKYVERWGVEHQFMAEEVQAKRRATNLLRYGTEEFTASEAAKLKIDHEAIQIKRTDTIIKRNKVWQSKDEIEFRDDLRNILGEDDVVHTIRVHRWPIDFYVKSLDTYVQFDGVYWHGLDRPIEIIKASEKPRDKDIYRKFCIDIEQKIWFKEHKLRLVRITDLEYKKCKKSDVSVGFLLLSKLDEILRND